MFDEMPDQFYQFLAGGARTRTTASTATPHHHPSLSFSLHHHHHHHGSSFQPTFDPSGYSPQQGFLSPPPPPPISNLLHLAQLGPLMHLQLKNEDKEGAVGIDPIQHSANWSNDEVLALLRIRSSLDNNWFPDFIWENVSRKLGELGFKRSAEKCKEKFEEETRSFNTTINASNNNNNNCSTKNTTIQNYRLFGELEDLYNNHHPQQQCPPQLADENGDHHDQSPSRQLDEEEADAEAEGEDEDKRGTEEEEEKRDIGNDKVVGEANSVDDSEKTEENTKRVIRKRKRQKNFEMFKGFCESIVNKMIAQQEELHCKILQDMVKRDEEKIAREEAWKTKEIERIQKEMEVRAHELAIVGDRQAKILSFLNNFTSSSTSFSLESQSLIGAIDNLLKVQKHTSSTSTYYSSVDLTQDSIMSAQQPTSSCTIHDHNPSFLVTHNCPINMPTSSSNENLGFQIPNRVETSKLALSQNPNENTSFKFPSIIPTDKSSGSTNHTNTDAVDYNTIDYRSPENQTEPKPKPKTENRTEDDIGRRWPRDEVLALINIRCSLLGNSTNGDGTHHESKGIDDHQSSVTKGIPLWERISQRMMEMGYKRNAKRCKEKWENINKYFRKTKDLNKKRSIDSRTCPYFNQLSHLYNTQTQQGEGTLLLGTSDPQVVSQLPPDSPENSRPTAVRGGSANGATTTTVHGTSTAQGDNQGSSVVLGF